MYRGGNSPAPNGGGPSATARSLASGETARGRWKVCSLGARNSSLPVCVSHRWMALSRPRAVAATALPSADRGKVPSKELAARATTRSSFPVAVSQATIRPALSFTSQSWV